MKTSQTDHRDTFGNARITKKAPIRVGTSHSDRAQGFHKQPVIEVEDGACDNDGMIPEEKRLEDHTVGELLLVKEDYDEVYGKVSFAKYVGKYIIGMLGLEEVPTVGVEEIVGQGKKSFAEILMKGSEREEKTNAQENLPMKPSNPKVVGGNVVVELDVDEYKKGVEQLMYNAIGRLSVPRSEPLPSTMEIQAKLLEGFWIEEVKVIAMGKSFFHLIFNNLDDQCKILSEGSFFLKPVFMCFTRWVPGFNFLK